MLICNFSEQVLSDHITSVI